MRICHNVSPFAVYIITVADPGEGPRAPSPSLFLDRGAAKNFFETPPPPSSPYLKVWIRPWITHTRSNIAGMQRSISEVRRVNFDCNEEKHGRICLRSFFVVIFAISVTLEQTFTEFNHRQYLRWLTKLFIQENCKGFFSSIFHDSDNKCHFN